jgi:outer membrane protein OmpA-like peptidoglycan-associated protein
MRNCNVLALLLSTAIALPAFAQQANSNSSSSQTTSADQSATASQREPLQDTRGDFWDGDQPGAGALIFHPFASKGYVRRKTAPIHDRLNELEEITNASSSNIKSIDTRTQQGIQLASTRTKEADQHALDASNQAQAAQQSASALNTRVSKTETIVGGIDQYKSGSQTVIRFRSGQSVLSQDAKRALDDMAAQLKDQRGYVVEVHGFAPGRGQAAIAASRKMADSVVRYLVLNHEIPAYRIYAIGMGDAPATAEQETTAKRVTGSRVEVNVLKNNLDQLASTAASNTSAK